MMLQGGQQQLFVEILARGMPLTRGNAVIHSYQDASLGRLWYLSRIQRGRISVAMEW